MTLLPCPFCGSEAETFEASEDSFSILCTGCGVETPYLPYLTEAIAAWNRRADHLPDATKMVSNADRIRGMSDEELAEYIFDLGNGSEYCYGHCAYQDDCATKGLDHDTCIKGVVDWLKQPAKEET